jgi:hypothetical protein
MNRRRSLKPSQPLLVGRLVLSPGSRLRRPQLSIEVWCPSCKITHQHGWADPPFASDAVSHAVAHCGTAESPYYESGYFTGLDPSHAEHNRKLAHAAADAIVRWEVGQETASAMGNSAWRPTPVAYITGPSLVNEGPLPNQHPLGGRTARPVATGGRSR